MIRGGDKALLSRYLVDDLNCLEAAARYAPPGRTNSDFPTTALPTQPRRIEMHKLTDADLDQFLALTSARTERSMTVTNANANPVVPDNGRLVSCGAL
jgi:hypothetical protein